MLTFSPLGEKVNTNMALIHRQVKKSTLGKIVNNHPTRVIGFYAGQFGFKIIGATIPSMQCMTCSLL